MVDGSVDETPPSDPVNRWIAQYVRPVALPIALSWSIAVLVITAWRLPFWSGLTDLLRQYFGALWIGGAR